MIWQAPLAWLGLLVLALPVLIHLLRRRNSRVQPFPTLRFLDVSRLPPARRARIRDRLLLAVRVSILAAAVAALAQPLLLTGARRQVLDRTIARVILVDTSASMHGAGPSGATPIDSARAIAVALSADAGSVIVVETAAPAASIEGSAQWLARRPGRRELVVVSDFQAGTLDSVDLARMPMANGVRLVRASSEPVSPLTTATRSTSGATHAAIALQGDRTHVEWTYLDEPPVRADSGLILLAGEMERDDAGAAYRAALTLAPGFADPARPLAIVFAGYEGREEIARIASAPDGAWMGDALVRVSHDATFIAAAAVAAARAEPLSRTGFVPIGVDSAGTAVAFGARSLVEGRETLVLFLQTDARSLASAALIAAAAGATSTSLPFAELDPATIDDDVLARWQREPGAAAVTASADAGASDGRWFWVVALLMLSLESRLRRNRSSEERGP